MSAETQDYAAFRASLGLPPPEVDEESEPCERLGIASFVGVRAPRGLYGGLATKGTCSPSDEKAGGARRAAARISSISARR